MSGLIAGGSRSPDELGSAFAREFPKFGLHLTQGDLGDDMYHWAVTKKPLSDSDATDALGFRSESKIPMLGAIHAESSDDLVKQIRPILRKQRISLEAAKETRGSSDFGFRMKRLAK